MKVHSCIERSSRSPLQMTCWLFFLAMILETAAWGQTFSYRIVDFPGAAATGTDRNNNAGDIVGFYSPTPSNSGYGFLIANGIYRTIAYPGAASTEADGINSADVVVGVYWQNNLRHGFALVGSKYRKVDFPGAVESNAAQINDNDVIVGSYSDGSHWHGYIRSQASG